MPYLREKNNGISLDIHVQPKAAKARLVGLHGTSLKVCVTAPPVEGKANAAVTAFFAALFHLPKSSISIDHGQQGRHKRLFILGLSAAAARECIAASLPEKRGCPPHSSSTRARVRTRT